MKDIKKLLREKMMIARDYALTLPFLLQGDRIFQLQAADINMRRAEIMRLTRIRRNYALVCALWFVLCFWSGFPGPRHGGTGFSWILFALAVVAFYDVQNRLRLLQLAELFYSRR